MDGIAPGKDAQAASPHSARLAFRSGAFTGTTAGPAPGHIQGNIVIMPSEYSAMFAAFCRANHQSCPLLAMSLPGDPSLPTLGTDIDMRHDLPGYLVYRDGAVGPEITAIATLWCDDMVTFVIGCSFTFEAALIAAGMPPRHIDRGCNVAMYRTNRQTIPAGPFHGSLVASMRPLRQADVDRAIKITGGSPDIHGARPTCAPNAICRCLAPAAISASSSSSRSAVMSPAPISTICSDVAERFSPSPSARWWWY
jgi:uncharacterized protein YcsI (UPF0317 family)